MFNPIFFFPDKKRRQARPKIPLKKSRVELDLSKPSKPCVETQTEITKIKQSTVGKHKAFKPRRLRCDIPFEQDLEYAPVFYRGYGPAIMFQGVLDGATICLSMKMLNEITRHLDRL